MSANKFSMDDYIDVAERIIEFNKKYPDGTLQTIDWKVTEVGGKTFIVYRAAAYRTADDRRPGHGTAWEPFPGPTPYTKDSELMNAETAAWGRAIVACGLPASRKIASKQEVRARQGNGNGQTAQGSAQTSRPTAAVVPLATPKDIEALVTAAKGLTARQIKLAFSAAGLTAPDPFPAKLGAAFVKVPQAKTADLYTALGSVQRPTEATT